MEYVKFDCHITKIHGQDIPVGNIAIVPSFNDGNTSVCLCTAKYSCVTLGEFGDPENAELFADAYCKRENG